MVPDPVKAVQFWRDSDQFTDILTQKYRRKIGAAGSGPIYRHYDEKLLADFSSTRIAKDNELSALFGSSNFGLCLLIVQDSGKHVSCNRRSPHRPYTPT